MYGNPSISLSKTLTRLYQGSSVQVSDEALFSSKTLKNVEDKLPDCTSLYLNVKLKKKEVRELIIAAFEIICT